MAERWLHQRPIVNSDVGGAIPEQRVVAQHCVMTTATNIGTRIRTLRKQMRITQADLGAAIGSSRTHVTNIERGKDKPGRELLVAIANELKVSLDWLTEGHGEARPAKALDENEAMLLFAFRQLPEDERYAHLNLMLKRVQRDA